jgi:glycerol-3-phosphate acyltransferase PlsX
MGTDSAPAPEVRGAIDALACAGRDCEIVLVGDRGRVESELAAHGDASNGRISVVDAPERIGPGEGPVAAIRKKPRSSIVVGVKLLKEGEVDAFVSAGSTGAVMAASLLMLRPLPGVDRPAIGTLLPTAKKPMLLLDAGANVDCKPQHLVQFAHLGHVYAQDLLGVESPRVGLLNIGEEPEKGNELSVEAHGLLAAEPGLNFIGNVESREILRGTCDVLVCDGFAGNVILKFYESVARFLIGVLKEELEAKEAHDLDLSDLFRFLDYEEYGGAPLLGVNGISIITHGSSSPKAISSALEVAAKAVESSMVSHMAGELAIGTGA